MAIRRERSETTLKRSGARSLSLSLALALALARERLALDAARSAGRPAHEESGDLCFGLDTSVGPLSDLDFGEFQRLARPFGFPEHDRSSKAQTPVSISRVKIPRDSWRTPGSDVPDAEDSVAVEDGLRRQKETC